MIRFAFLIALCPLILSGCATSYDVQFPVKEERVGVHKVSADVGVGYITGQPDQSAFAAYAADGVATVVNLRTPAEMSDPERVPFDQSNLMDQLGLRYIETPVGGDTYPYSPAAVDVLAQAIEESEGKVLLHCGSAGRASQVWAAYLMKYEGLSEAEAVRHAEAINLMSDFKRDELLGAP